MKKSIITILFTIAFLLMLTTLVYGAGSQITINGDTEAKPGETKELTINISSEEEIGVISGKIEANSNITNMTVTGLNNWNLTYNSNTGVFNIVKAEGAKSEAIIKIGYKAGNEEGTGTITLSNIKMTTISYVTEEKENVVKSITIANTEENGEAGTGEPENGQPTAGEPENGQPTAEEPKKDAENPAKADESTPKKTETEKTPATGDTTTTLPKAGVAWGTTIVTVSLGTASIIFYVLYKKYKNI